MGASYRKTTYDKASKRKETWNHLEQLNEETGEYEIFDDVEYSGYGEQRFMKVNTAMLLDIFLRISGNARLVFSFILNRANRGTNIAAIKQKEVIEKTGLGKSTVERSFQELQKEDLIRMKESCQWMVNPNLATGCKREYKDWLLRKYYELLSFEAKKRLNQKGDDSDVT